MPERSTNRPDHDRLVSTLIRVQPRGNLSGEAAVDAEHHVAAVQAEPDDGPGGRVHCTLGDLARFDADEAKIAKYAGFHWRRHQSAAFEAEDGRTWRLEAYFAVEPDEEAIRELARSVIGDAIDEARAVAMADQAVSAPTISTSPWAKLMSWMMPYTIV